eukprot:Clim_evm62s203 gene=Clim_evmTU62s203
MATTITKLPSISRISDRVVRVMGGNPSLYTLSGSCTYLVGSGQDRILIDTGQGFNEWTENLKQALTSEGANVKEVLITHHHADHVGGIPDLVEYVKKVTGQTPRIRKYGPDQIAYSEGVKFDGWLKDGDTISVPGATVRTLYTPGHTKDHVAFYLEEERSIFTGDCVLGEGTAVFTDLSELMTSLRRMKAEQPDRLYPGHGPECLDATAKLQEYISHREERSDQIIEFLEGKRGGSATAMQMVKHIYADYPEQYHTPAEANVLLHLLHLEDTGHVGRSVPKEAQDKGPGGIAFEQIHQMASKAFQRDQEHYEEKAAKAAAGEGADSNSDMKPPSQDAEQEGKAVIMKRILAVKSVQWVRTAKARNASAL